MQGEGRPGSAHRAHHKRKQTQRQRQKQRRQQDRGGDQPGARDDGVCCGATTACAPPEPGSTRARCDFNQHSIAGQDQHGADFRQIAGAGATFDATDNQGSAFAEACLRYATFRGANLAGTSWDGACLFAADFTGADVGGDPDALAGAVLCATILPNGARSDRDCGRSQAHPCCLPPPGGGGLGGGQSCGPCTPADQCHVAGTCVCTTPTAPNRTPCTDGNPLCLVGVCCTDGHEAINGGCFQVSDRGCRCNRDACDGCYGNVDGSTVDGRNSFLCGFRTGPDCGSNADCPVGHACFLGEVLVWLHHSNIDRLWSEWQHRHGSTYEPVAGGPVGQNIDDTMWPYSQIGITVSPSLLLDHRALGYRYDTEQ